MIYDGKEVLMKLKMGNRMKKMMGVLLAAVMMMSMSMSVFAAPNDTVEVVIQLYGKEAYTQTVSVSEIQNEAGTDEHYYDTSYYSDYDEEGIKVPTVADALIKTYAMTYNQDALTIANYDPSYPPTEQPVSYGWDLQPVEGNPGIYFQYYDGLTTANETYEPNPDGTTTYTGDTWVLSVDGEETSLYASNIELSSVDQIVFDYTEVSFIF